jgi:hypothetical protein
MNEPTGTIFPHAAPAGDSVMLEGMKLLFDDKVGLFPVKLVAREQSVKSRRNGRVRRRRAALRF